MTYRGFGSGILRALQNQPNIELLNDTEGEQFTVRIPRPAKKALCRLGKDAHLAQTVLVNMENKN